MRNLTNVSLLVSPLTQRCHEKAYIGQVFEIILKEKTPKTGRLECNDCPPSADRRQPEWRWGDMKQRSK